MALRALMLGKKLSAKKTRLEELRAKMTELETREAEIAQAIEEAETDEEKAAVEEAVTAFETEKGNVTNEVESLETEVRELENELEQIETPAPAAEPEARSTAAEPETRTREEIPHMKKRFRDWTMDQKRALVEREEVQQFLGVIRTAMREKRAVTGTGALIPTVILDLLRDNIEEYSKLYSRVNMQPVAGIARQPIQGAIPEAVWTEVCANLNELDLSFTGVEVDAFRVGGFFRVCKATIDDTDPVLTNALIEALGQAIGYALDKAILYGTGTKMPVGVVTALAAETGTPNIVSHAATVTGAALVKALVLDSGKMKSKYSRGAKLWAMNETTYTTLLAELVEVDASGAYVSAVNGVMPVIGGDIIVLDFIPDNTIIGGYFDLYLLAERAGTNIETSEHAFFIEDQIAFKGTARYDGKVIRTAAFVAIGINGVTPAANAVSFAPDTANTTQGTQGE